MSEGSNWVITVTCEPAKLSGGAWSPPKPCPKTLSTKIGIEKIPTKMKSKGSLYNHCTMVKIPYLSIRRNYRG